MLTLYGPIIELRLHCSHYTCEISVINPWIMPIDDIMYPEILSKQSSAINIKMI